jgi:NCS2 family nucleobase:cation symporter-2
LQHLWANRSARRAEWIAVPWPAVLDCAFDIGLVPAFLAAGAAVSLRAVGVVTTCQRINNAAWRRPVMGNVRKGALANGLANIVGG